MNPAGRAATAIVVAGASGIMALSVAPAGATTTAQARGAWAAVPAAARGPIRASVERAASAAKQQAVETADLTASDGANGNDLGYSVAISGNTIVVGAPFHEVGTNFFEGALYVFTKPKTGWANASKPATLTVAGQTDQGVGRSVAIDGNTIVAGIPGGDGEGGTGGVYVFTKPATGWATSSHPTTELSASVPDIDGSDALGWSVAISGKTIVAGAPYHSTSNSDPNDGVAYVYVEPPTGWAHATTEAAQLAPTDPSDLGDNFGHAVAIDGNTVVVGSIEHGTGSAYVFVKPAGGWSDAKPTRQTAELSAGTALFGSSVAVQGKTVVVGSLDPGAAYVFNEPAAGWPATMTKPSDTLTSNEQRGSVTGDIGAAVAIDGTTIAVGGPTANGATPAHDEAGAVLLFTKPAAGWKGAQHEVNTLVCRHPTGMLGAAAAISGKTIVAGAPGNYTGDISAGAAFVYSAPATTPKPVLSKVTESRKTWKPSSALPSLNPKHKPKGGTEFSFSTNEKARVTLRFALVKGNKRIHKATLTEPVAKGMNHLYFAGRISKKSKLVRGRYVVTIVASTGGAVSTTKSLSFTLR